MNLIDFNNIFLYPGEGGKVDLSKGLYFVFLGACNVVKSRTSEIVGEDILLKEFVNYSRFLNEFKCRHQQNNFYKLIVASMDSHHSKYTWREEVFAKMNKILDGLQKRAKDYEAIFETDRMLPVESVFSDITLPWKNIKITRSEKITNGRQGS